MKLKQYLKDFHELTPSISCSEEQLIEYASSQIRSLLKSKITEKLQGTEQIDINELWTIIDKLS